METSLNMVPITRSNAMQPVPGSETAPMTSIKQENGASEFKSINRAGRDFTLAEKKERLKGAAEDFEAIFARQLMKHMRSGLIGDGMFGPGAAGEIYSDMMDTAVADKIAERGSLGLADMLYSQMVKQLEPRKVPDAAESTIKF